MKELPPVRHRSCLPWNTEWLTSLTLVLPELCVLGGWRVATGQLSKQLAYEVTRLFEPKEGAQPSQEDRRAARPPSLLWVKVLEVAAEPRSPQAPQAGLIGLVCARGALRGHAVTWLPTAPGGDAPLRPSGRRPALQTPAPPPNRAAHQAGSVRPGKPGQPSWPDVPGTRRRRRSRSSGQGSPREAGRAGPGRQRAGPRPGPGLRLRLERSPLQPIRSGSPAREP